MKHKLMLGLVLSSVLSANGFALEINGGKLIGHKEWATGKVIKSSSKEMNSSAVSKMPKHDFQQNRGGNWINANSMTLSYKDETIPVNADATFGGIGDVHIVNDSTTQKTYVITAYLDVQPPCPPSSLCPVISKMSEDLVMLDPQGSVKILKEVSLTTSFDEAGYAMHNAGISVWDSTAATTYNTWGVKEIIEVVDSKKSK